MGSKRINVGLLVSNIHNEYDNAVVEGVMQGAKELDCNLIIVPGRYINADYFDKVRNKNEYQYNSLFSYINKNNIDVLLVILGTIATTLSDEEKRQFLSMYDGIPITLMACTLEGYSSVNFDNTAGLREGISDLINNRNCKHICMVSGPLTSIDARERLGVYKQVLSENNLELTDKQIVYGNFSEYCEDIVEELLQNNPEADAIVFANDSMAIGGYNVLKRHNIAIGEDICVMGFDDTPSSVQMVPHLTSVKADGTLLGKEAIIASVNNRHASAPFDMKVNTSIVKRSSTGYSDELVVKKVYNEEFDLLLKSDARAAAKAVFEAFTGDNIYQDESDFYEKYVVSLISGLFNQISVGREMRILPSVRKNIDALFDTTYGRRIDFTRFMQVSDLIRSLSIKCFPDKESFINEVSYMYLTYASKRIVANNKAEYKKLSDHMWISNCVARDMLYYNEEEAKGYATVIDKFYYIGYHSAMLYALDSPYIFDSDYKISGWSKPDSFKLKNYFFDSETITLVDPKDQDISSDQLFTNRFVPTDRRFTFILDLIYSHDELLGMMVCEVNYSQIKFMDSLMAQICSACKHLSTYKAYKNIQLQLEKALEEIKTANMELASISVTDELTGILNRRGFFEKIKELIDKEENKNRRCEMIFCDMDNLKLINDQFSHDEGDFALRCSANIIKKAVGSEGVISRIGGDEYAAFAFIDDSPETDICDRIHDECNTYNAISDKPYYIDLSTGSVTFLNEEGVDVNKKLDEADDILYQNKRYKRKNVLKK